jgi:predicted TIM-barrel fold metal-dependent hydrolase
LKVAFFGANPCENTGRPGALLEYFETAGGTGNALFHGGMISAVDLPPSRFKSSRIELLDDMTVEAALLFPTLAVGVEYQLSKDREAYLAGLNAFNRWLEEDWGFGENGRLFGVPLLTLIDIDWAVAELERVLALGARMVHLKAGPVDGRSPADPSHDPFWARCNEAGIPVAFHLGNSGEAEYYSAMWGEAPNPPNHRYSPFQRVTSFGERAIHDTLLALVTHNLFGRFPQLKVLSVEFGSEWVGPLLKKTDRAARMCGPKDWPFGAVKERPREVFKRHILVSPYPEDDVVSLVRLIGEDAVIAGSDWPHPEGVTAPTKLASRLVGELSATAVRKVMRDNSAGLLGLAVASS